MSKQNDIEHVMDQLERGLITPAQGNVQMVRNERVRLITGRLHQPVRTALNEAVKAGELGHMKKEGHKPEAYYHPTFKHLAVSARRQHEADTMRAVAAVAGRRIA